MKITPQTDDELERIRAGIEEDDALDSLHCRNSGNETYVFVAILKHLILFC